MLLAAYDRFQSEIYLAEELNKYGDSEMQEGTLPATFVEATFITQEP